MGQAISAIFKWISSSFSFCTQSSHEQQIPKPTQPESTVNIIFDNTTRINLHPSSSYADHSSDSEYTISDSSSECDSDDEAISSHIIDVGEAGQSSITPGVKWKNRYSSQHQILLVGEGDFSFSASLCKLLGSATNIIATSLNSREYLEKNYRNASSNIKCLEDRGGVVLHGVDATQMANSSGFRFDRIVFNFPHAGCFKQEHSRQTQLSRHRALVCGFLENAKEMISENGEIHITHKNNGFFREWNLEASAKSRGLRLLQELPFNFKDYPGYRTKFGFGGDKNFNCNPSSTYIFGLFY